MSIPRSRISRWLYVALSVPDRKAVIQLNESARRGGPTLNDQDEGELAGASSF
jgi:hypothetical protein